MPFANINADPAVMECFPYTLTASESDAFIQRIEAHFERHGFGLYAVELRESGQLAGFVGLLVPSFEAPFTPCVEIGWRLARRFWGRGFATEGARYVLDYGFDRIGLSEIVSFTVPANVRSIAVMERLGMKRDLNGDFDHPLIPQGHPLQRHVLYRLSKANREAQTGASEHRVESR